MHEVSPRKAVRVIENNQQYLTKDLLLSLFKEGETVRLDKGACGNGGSTSFSEIITEGKINILISPHRGFVIDKEEKYKGLFKDRPFSFYLQKEATANKIWQKRPFLGSQQWRIYLLIR